MQRDVVEPPVPDGGIGHPIGREGHDCTDDGASSNVVPVVVLVDGEGSTNQDSSQNRGIRRDQLPHGRVIVGENLELGVEVEVEVDEASKCGGGVSARHGLQRIVDLFLVASANVTGIVDASEALSVVARAVR